MLDKQAIIERSLYEKVRSTIVASGFTPDVTTFPDTSIGFQNYQAALANIKTLKGFAIELFSFSPPEEKGIIKHPRLVLYSDAFIPGTVGVQPTPRLVPNEVDGGFDAIHYDPLAYDLLFSAHIQAETTEQFRVLRDILHRTFPPFTYIPVLGTDAYFLCLLNGAENRDQYREGALEGIHRFTVPDILFSVTTYEAAAVAIEEIKLNIEIAEHLGISLTLNS